MTPTEFPFKRGKKVIVETAQGLECGVCASENAEISEGFEIPLKKVVRIADEKDLAHLEENHKKEKEAFGICSKKIAAHGLEMKLISVEYTFDNSKIIFFFTADGRVDFRELVRDLASVFHTRVELRQVGVRDEAKLLGGIGICGREFCCSKFLNAFQPVSIKMAKEQNLSLNPVKISGTCGRLMCCLKYEQGAYEDAVKRCPKQDSFVECPDGAGTISSVNLLREQVKVRLEDSAEQPKTYRASEIRVVRSGKGKRPEDYVVPPKEELEKLRYIPRRRSAPPESWARAPTYPPCWTSTWAAIPPQAGRRVRSVNRDGAETAAGTEGDTSRRVPSSSGGRRTPAAAESGSNSPGRTNLRLRSSPKRSAPRPSRLSAPVQAEGNKSGGGKRRHRPYHRRSKSPAPAQGGTGEKQS